jgi:hypothetical protein
VQLPRPDPQDARWHPDRPAVACARPRRPPVPGLYAAGEVAGFGGGGVHGYNALEGTFLGGCLFSGPGSRARAAAGARLTPHSTGAGLGGALEPACGMSRPPRLVPAPQGLLPRARRRQRPSCCSRTRSA